MTSTNEHAADTVDEVTLAALRKLGGIVPGLEGCTSRRKLLADIDMRIEAGEGVLALELAAFGDDEECAEVRRVTADRRRGRSLLLR